ncbi:MAG: glycerol-3-phosphate 1-O-acyltransferase PlsY [Bacteroidales bacterium]|jgi:glycerol-3-phosphate acyltransferase PlsY|nr:glycerol-3-phosphate 1-O-acyltransferase PlsY [Bacteroidales bacterium]
MEGNYTFILGILLAYLLGAIPTSVWVGKIFYKTDIRQQGSGNAGGTNAVRILGWMAGIPVIIFDIFKGWFAVFYLPGNFPETTLLPNDYLMLVYGLAAVIGHVFPIYVGFKGGKGVGTLAGVGLAFFPWALLAALGVFLIVAIPTRYVSLGSIVAAISFPLFLIFAFNETSIPVLFLGIFSSLFIVFTHRTNIERLLKGEENRFIVKQKTKK